MRLINTETLQLQYFVANVPQYVILSHTWGEDEVLFDDIGQPYASKMAGYDKIQGCCEQAKKDGFQWAWIDTCCIDKKSSAELSEAINSMYKWYWEAATCYAYLADVVETGGRPDPCSPETPCNNVSRVFEDSRWFTRGWTLQELLAPAFVEFYSRGWQRLGSRSKLIDPVVRATKIERRYLLDRQSLQTASIATRFSWASLRQTTRAEDMAYCLLGLLNINMPMLYGEGPKAFYRLQLELIKQTNEHTIFAWQQRIDQQHLFASTVLASSPAAFEASAYIQAIVSDRPSALRTFEMTNNGLRINLPCVAMNQERVLAIFDCKNERGDRLGMWLERYDGERVRRLPDSRLTTVKFRDLEDAETLELYADAVPLIDRLQSGFSCELDVNEHAWSHRAESILVLSNSLWIDPKDVKTGITMKEDAFVRVNMVSHRVQSFTKSMQTPSFAIFIGLHGECPTIRCVQGYNTISRPQLEQELMLDNSKYVRDYYKAPLCCGNTLEVELRRVQSAGSSRWKMRVTIEGCMPDENLSWFARPDTCTQTMALDGDVQF